MDVEWIREQLVTREMTQADLASRIDLTPVQLSKVLNGSRQLKSDEADKIRAALGAKATQAYEEDPDKTKIIEYFDAMSPAQREALIQFLEKISSS